MEFLIINNNYLYEACQTHKKKFCDVFKSIHDIILHLLGCNIVIQFLYLRMGVHETQL